MRSSGRISPGQSWRGPLNVAGYVMLCYVMLDRVSLKGTFSIAACAIGPHSDVRKVFGVGYDIEKPVIIRERNLRSSSASEAKW